MAVSGYGTQRKSLQMTIYIYIYIFIYYHQGGICHETEEMFYYFLIKNGVCSELFYKLRIFNIMYFKIFSEIWLSDILILLYEKI